MRRFFLLLLALALGAASPGVAGAQYDSPLGAGTLVRVHSPMLGGAVKGRVVRMDSATLVVRRGESEFAIPVSELEAIEVAGRRRYLAGAVRGVLIGAAAGGAVGLVVGSAVDTDGFAEDLATLFGGIGGAIVGGGVGLGVGLARAPHEWEPLRSPNYPSLGGGMGLEVRISVPVGR